MTLRPAVTAAGFFCAWRDAPFCVAGGRVPLAGGLAASGAVAQRNGKSIWDASANGVGS
jgi:hypothetical protein